MALLEIRIAVLRHRHFLMRQHGAAAIAVQALGDLAPSLYWLAP
jgi:hypothetical protein